MASKVKRIILNNEHDISNNIISIFEAFNVVAFLWVMMIKIISKILIPVDNAPAFRISDDENVSVMRKRYSSSNNALHEENKKRIKRLKFDMNIIK